MITIILPFWQVAKTIKHTINSILANTYQDWTLLAINNNCTDDSVDIVKQFNDPRIQLIHMPVNNLVDARNIGFNLANTKYICKMDADDLMFPDRLYRQLDFMESHPDIDMISSCYIGFGDDCYSYLPKTQKVTLEMQLKNNCLSQPTAMIRTESFKGLDGPYRHGYDRAEDYELWTRAIANGVNIWTHGEVVLHYRFSPSNQHVAHTAQMLASIEKIKNEYKKCLQTDQGLVL